VVGLKDQLKLLINLQELDIHILKKQLIINEIPLNISGVETRLNKILTNLDKIKQGLESLEKKKRDKERTLDDINEKINKLKTRIKEIKTNKEYQAHLKEIESVEKERYAVEDEILLIMEEIEASLKELILREETIRSEKSKVDEFKKRLEGEVLEAEKELLALNEARSGIIGSIDEELYNLYMGLIKSGKGLAVVEAKEEICLGCNMNFPPQLFVELKKNEQIIKCPQCHRIIYYKSE
jgi:hypothetical protein